MLIDDDQVLSKKTVVEELSGPNVSNANDWKVSMVAYRTDTALTDLFDIHYLLIYLFKG